MAAIETKREGLTARDTTVVVLDEEIINGPRFTEDRAGKVRLIQGDWYNYIQVGVVDKKNPDTFIRREVLVADLEIDATKQAFNQVGEEVLFYTDRNTYRRQYARVLGDEEGFYCFEIGSRYDDSEHFSAERSLNLTEHGVSAIRNMLNRLQQLPPHKR